MAGSCRRRIHARVEYMESPSLEMLASDHASSRWDCGGVTEQSNVSHGSMTMILMQGRGWLNAAVGKHVIMLHRS